MSVTCDEEGVSEFYFHGDGQETEKRITWEDVFIVGAYRTGWFLDLHIVLCDRNNAVLVDAHDGLAGWSKLLVLLEKKLPAFPDEKINLPMDIKAAGVLVEIYRRG
jgi:hypothetical protein